MPFCPFLLNAILLLGSPWGARSPIDLGSQVLVGQLSAPTQPTVGLIVNESLK